MPEGTPQLVIEVYAAPGEEPQIIVRPGAGASTTIAPLAAPPAPKRRGRPRKADQDAAEASTTTKPAPKNGRRKKKATKKKATKKKATKKRGRQPLPDRQMLQASEGDSVAELFRLEKKWYLTINGEPANDGKGWISRKQALAHATEVMGEVEVIADEEAAEESE